MLHSEELTRGSTYRWKFNILSAGGSYEDCSVSVVAKSLRQALTKTEEMLGIDGKGPDADCAGALSRHALAVVKSVEEL